MQKDYPNYSIEAVTFDNATLNTKALQAVTTTGGVDLIFNSASRLLSLYQQSGQAFEPLNDVLESCENADVVTEGDIKLCSAGDDLIVFPVSRSLAGLGVKTDVEGVEVTEDTMSTTWDKFLALGEQYQAAGKSGFTMHLGTDPGQVFNLFMCGSGYYCVGGVCGYNNDQSTIKKCYNTGEVTGNNHVGGVCGENYNYWQGGSTIQECYNTGKVTGNTSVGGVCGKNATDADNGGTIKECYNTGKVTGNSSVGGVCGYMKETGVRAQDCYYLEGTSAKAFGSGTGGANCESKTALQFRNGEVAFLLQKAAVSEETWGQTIGTDEYLLLKWQMDEYKKVCKKTSTTCNGYSNMDNDTSGHKYENGACIYCGQLGIAYTVTIPAEVKLGETATITAEGVTLPTNKKLNVKMGSSSDSEFTVALIEDTKAVDTQTYTVKNSENKYVKPGDTVLSVEKGENAKSTTLNFNAPTSTTYSGEYKGTVTFTVSVADN